MWVLTEEGSTAVNLDHVFIIYAKAGNDGSFGIMAIRDRGDMGTLLKVCESEEEARRFINGLLSAANARPQTLSARRVGPAWEPPEVNDSA